MGAILKKLCDGRVDKFCPFCKKKPKIPLRRVYFTVSSQIFLPKSKKFIPAV